MTYWTLTAKHFTQALQYIELIKNRVIVYIIGITRHAACQALNQAFKLHSSIMLFFRKAGGGIDRRHPGSNLRIGPPPHIFPPTKSLQNANASRTNIVPMYAEFGVDAILGQGEWGWPILYYNWRYDLQMFMRGAKIMRVCRECYSGKREE